MSIVYYSLNMVMGSNFCDLCFFKSLACFDKLASFLIHHHMHGNFSSRIYKKKSLASWLNCFNILRV